MYNILEKIDTDLQITLASATSEWMNVWRMNDRSPLFTLGSIYSTNASLGAEQLPKTNNLNQTY